MYNNISLSRLSTNLVTVTRTRDAVQNRCWQTRLVVNGSRVQGYRHRPRQQKAEGKAKVDLPHDTAYWAVRKIRTQLYSRNSHDITVLLKYLLI